MSGRLLLGIDIGTTGVRVAVFDAHGTLLGDASVPCPYDSPHAGWAETDAERWWRAVQTAVSHLVPTTMLNDLSEVDCIGVVGQAPTVVLVDENATPLAPAIQWLDVRATAEAHTLGVDAYYAGPKLAWLAKHSPGLLSNRARWLLQSHSFVAMRLTGKASVDPSTAALCKPLFSLDTLAWDPTATNACGVRSELLPPVHHAHEILGIVSSKAAAEIGHGLRAGTAVVVGGGDFAAAALSAGATKQGEACLMLGTAGNLLVPRATPGTDPRLINAHHVGTARTWLSLGGTLSGGAQTWLQYALSRATVDKANTNLRHSLPPFETLDDEAAEIPAGSDGLLFLPYLQGERTPIWDPEARGAFVGLGLEHGRGHLWRATLEAIALSFASCQNILRADGVQIDSVVATNGGGKSRLFRQILCDALGVPLRYMPQSGGTVAGAAMLAGIGVGAIANVEDTKSWRKTPALHEPNRALHVRYRELLAIRDESYVALKPTFSSLAAYRR